MIARTRETGAVALRVVGLLLLIGAAAVVLAILNSGLTRGARAVPEAAKGTRAGRPAGIPLESAVAPVSPDFAFETPAKEAVPEETAAARVPSSHALDFVLVRWPDGEPLRNALVFLTYRPGLAKRERSADGSGRVQLEPLGTGARTIELEVAGFEPRNLEPARLTSGARVELTPLSGWFGRVVDEEGEPVEGALVSGSRLRASISFRGRENLRWTWTEAGLAGEGTKIHALSLPSLGELGFPRKAREDAPEEEVTFFRTDCHAVYATAPTTASGHYYVPPPDSDRFGELFLQASLGATRAGALRWPVKNLERNLPDLPLGEAPRFLCRVQDTRGRALEGVEILLLGPDPLPHPLGRARTDSDGVARILVPELPVLVHLGRPGYEMIPARSNFIQGGVGLLGASTGLAGRDDSKRSMEFDEFRVESIRATGALTSLSMQAAEPTEVRVLVEKNDAPISGAKVVARYGGDAEGGAPPGFEATTGGDGVARIPRLVSPTNLPLWIEASPEGYQPSKLQILHPRVSSVEIRTFLLADRKPNRQMLPLSISGVVHGIVPPGAANLQGAVSRQIGGMWSRGRPFDVQPDGKFTSSFLSSEAKPDHGAAFVRVHQVTPAGILGASLGPVSLQAERTAGLELTLERVPVAFDVTGLVPHWRFFLLLRGRPLDWPKRETVELGRYELPASSSGTRRLNLTLPPDWEVRAALLTQLGGAQLGLGPAVTLRTTHAAGQSVALRQDVLCRVDGVLKGVEAPAGLVVAFTGLHPDQNFYGRVGVDGAFRLDHVLPGNYIVSVYPEGLGLERECVYQGWQRVEDALEQIVLEP